MKEFGWFALIAGVIILEVSTAPGTPFTGKSWKVSRSGAPGMVHLTLERAHLGSHSITTTDVPLANFRGFSLASLDRSGPIKFEYQHEAATLSCVGKISWGRAAGSFTLRRNPDFDAQLSKLGYSSPDEEDLYSMVLANITLEYARTVQEAGLGASLHQLIELRQHGVTTANVRDIGRAGYANFRAIDYIELKDHGVDSGYLRDLKSAGYRFRTADLVELKEHGVKPEFADDLKQAGYDLSADQMKELWEHGVNSGFLRELKMDGLHPPSTELVQLREHGVSPAYLRGLHEAGFAGLSADEIVSLREHGVQAEFANEARDLGYKFTPKELIELHEHGVDSRYLQNLRDSGMHNLTAPQIRQLKEHGVE